MLALANDSKPPDNSPSGTAALLGTNLLPDITDTTPPTNIFDSAATGSNVVFVLDHSTNMQNGGKSAAARQELLKHIKAMTPESKFDVLFFHSGGYDEMPGRGPLAATPENIGTITNWLFSVGHTNGTDPAKAVGRALGLGPAPDTIWLLAGDELSPAVVDAIRQTNALIRAHINTIDFYCHCAEQELRDIADQNHGVYRYVPPPDETSPPAAPAPANPPSSP